MSKLLLDARGVTASAPILELLDGELTWEDLVKAAQIRDVLERNRKERNERDNP